MSRNVYIDTYGRSHAVSKELSHGGQGIVYRTEEPDTLLKLEWNAKTQKVIEDPSGNTKFDDIRILPLLEKTNLTLPQAVLRNAAGYTMKLLDDMNSFEKVFSGDGEKIPDNPWLLEMGKEDPALKTTFKNYISSGGIRKRLNAYMKAACILAKIHASGLVYCDISDKNMFVSSDPEKTNVWLIDCDNLDYMKNTVKKGGWYTSGFPAPEVYQGKGNTMYSDVYSFAIALFWTLTEKHPFLGEAVEEAISEEDFIDDIEEDFACRGTFSWIGDREDDSNRSSQWDYCSMFVNEALCDSFQITFGEEGRKNRQKRTTMPEWSYVLAKELDHTVRCHHCQMDYYGNENQICPWCDDSSQRIHIKSRRDGQERNGKLWEFIHEQQKESINVPLRILEGFFCDHIDETAFWIKCTGSEIELGDLSNRYDFYVVEEGKQTLIYGSTKIVWKKDMAILAVCKNNGIRCFVEIEV